MTDEYSLAISFANSYFALVDGLAYGLEDHLAENVRLDWFGKIVKGKRNVAAFMRINMPNSRHMFDEITPTAYINQRRKRLVRRKYKSEGSSDAIGNKTDDTIQDGLNFSKLRIEDSSNDGKKEEKLEPCDPGSLFPDDIAARRSQNTAETSTKPEKIEHLTQEHGTQVPLIPKMECEPSSQTENTENSSIKFIRANGIVQIHRSTGPNKIRKWQSSSFVSGLPGQTCRRHCELQVAYSWRNDQVIKCEGNLARSRIACATTNNTEGLSDRGTKVIVNGPKTITKGRKRLNNYDEEGLESIGGSEQSFNPFEDFESFNDRQRFLEYFEAEMTPKFNFTSAKYIGNRLIFDWTRRNKSVSGNFATDFKFNYCIHSLVYESNKNCMASLSEEFEDRKSLSDTEKSV